MANEYKDYISFQGCTIEDKEAIEESIRRFPAAESFWDKFCDHKPWKKGAKRFSWRKLIKPDITVSDTTPLVEGVAPSPSKMVYAEYEDKVENYGGVYPYTKEAIQFRHDDTIADIAHEISYKTIMVPDTIIGKHMVTSKVQITAKSTLTDTFDKALVVFRKNKIKAFSNGKYVAVIVPELEATLKAELRAAGTSLPETKKSELFNGSCYDFDGFEIFVCSEDYMYTKSGSSTVTYTGTIVMLGQTQDGHKAECVTGNIAPEIIYNDLGSGVIKNSSGAIVSDANHREGSVAYNIDAIGVGTQYDYAKMTSAFSLTPVDADVKPASVSAESNYHAGPESVPANVA